MVLGIGSLPHLIEDLQVVVEDGGNDGHHVGLDDPCPDALRAAHTDVDNTLEGEAPFPHLHQILTPALLEDADESFDAAIDGEDIADSSGRGGEIRQMVQGVDQRQGRSAVEGPAVVKGGGDIDGRFVHIGDAEVDLSHDGFFSLVWENRMKERLTRGERAVGGRN